MKLLSSLPLLLLIITLGHAQEIILISFDTNLIQAREVYGILYETYQIPKDFTRMERRESPCLPDKNFIVHFCLNKEGTLKVPHIKKDIVKYSLESFASN